MPANSSFPGQRDLQVPYWRRKRVSPRRLSLEEIDTIHTLKRNGFSDREISRGVKRSLGVVGKYTRGMKPDPFIVAQQPILPTQHVDKTAATVPEGAQSRDGGSGQQPSSSSEDEITLADLNKLRKLEADYQFSQSPEGRMILGNLKKIKEINAILDRPSPELDIPESQSDRDWRRGFQKEVETALQHFRQGTHRSLDSWEQCVACKHALTPPPPLG